ncbi:Beta-N-acetylhexosaminidase [Catenulispora acidiphila DSM 44928]|uniref:beta-N-acetylhexosaminidase n=2 Tax=Catenulispora TaxID=414878 RepID=C7Q1E2_CATAD|nr:Beta-N-acetylhexosaminidase [Catenulispora acidiphila DSM 44928]
MPRTAAALSTCAALLALAACGGGSSGTKSSVPPASTNGSSSAPSVPLSPADPAALERVVPEPAGITAAAGTFTLTSATAIHASSGAEPVAADLAAYLKQQTGLAPAVSQSPDAAIQLVLQPSGGDPSLGTEGYTLVIGPSSVKLTAATDAGLFHGVQTVRQLLVGAKLQDGTITDHPRFAYRGVMLDVARHFYSVADVKAYIDAAALYKVNEFHLHLTDDQGWRFAVPGWPKLTSVGAATQVGGGVGGSYSAADLKEIVDYAASRYMTVIPEIDMPGHVGAAVYAYPSLACDGRHHGPVTSVSPAYDSLCTSSESTYRFVDTATKAAADATPGATYLHMGGDEAQALSLTQYNAFVAKTQNLVAGHDRTPIAWAEAGTATLLPQTVLEYWNTAQPQPYVLQAAAKGTKLIMAPGNHAYLDQQPVAGFRVGLHWAGYVPVSKAYDWDPVTVLPGIAPSAVLGVEAPLWSETVKNLADAETLAYPRLPAIAEIGWSAPNTHDWQRFSKRLAAQAPLWDKLGIAYYKSPEVPWGSG